MLVLSLRALAMGDLLAGVPALRAVRRAFPRAEHVLAAPRWLEPLARHMGAVDAVVDVAPLAPLPSALRDRVDVGVNLHGCGPQSHEVLLGVAPARVVGFAGPGVPDGPEWREGEHEAHRWCRMLRSFGIAADETDLDLAVPDRPVPAGAVGATVLHPFAGGRAREWPPERWAEVARTIVRGGARAVITGASSERARALAIARRAGLDDGAVLAGRLDLLDLAAVVGRAARVVCGDTGVAHLATALRRPSVVLFGPVPPSEWGPPPDRPWHRALWAGTRSEPYGDTPAPGLLAITVDQVVAALDNAAAP